jgi:hypothetical protein
VIMSVVFGAAIGIQEEPRAFGKQEKRSVEDWAKSPAFAPFFKRSSHAEFVLVFE